MGIFDFERLFDLNHDGMLDPLEKGLEFTVIEDIMNDDEGSIITLDAPSFVPFMKYCDDRSLRREVYMAYNTCLLYTSTGYPVQHSILSSTVIAKDCASADAYATAFMVMGLDSAKAFCEAHPELDAYFICSGEGDKYETYFTDGMKKFIASEK